MSSRDAAFLGCRLMAMWIAVRSLELVLPAWSELAYFRQNPSLAGDLEGSAIAKLIQYPQTYYCVADIVLAALLFYGASFLSRMLVAHPEQEATRPSIRGLFAVGALLIGLNAAIGYLPDLLGDLYARLTHAASARGADPAAIAANVIGILLAAILVVLTAVWSRREVSSAGGDGD